MLGGADRVTFDPSFNRGADIISLPGEAGSFTIARSGSSAVLSDGASQYTLPVGTAPGVVRFEMPTARPVSMTRRSTGRISSFRPDASGAHKAAIAHFEGGQDDRGVLDSGDANFARAQAAGRPMFKAALGGMSHDGAYAGPDRRWSKAILAWLDWQLKGDSNAATKLDGLGRNGWSRIDATGISATPGP